MTKPQPRRKKGKKKIELDWGMDPSERLRIEMESLQENDQMRLVAKELIAEFAKDPSLAEANRSWREIHGLAR